LAVISGIIAAALQVIATAILKTYFGMSLELSLFNLMGLVLIILILSVLSSIVPIWRALKMEVAQCLKE